MLTLALALLAALLLGTSYEGAVRLPGVVASCSFFRFGRVRAAAWAFRPGRVYIRIGAG